MNDHRKLVQDCINKRANNHAELLKKLDKTCERVAKNELKVWLTVEQVDEIQTLLAFLAREGKRQFIRQTAIDYERFLQKLAYQAKERKNRRSGG